jgi:hypothetical protein
VDHIKYVTMTDSTIDREDLKRALLELLSTTDAKAAVDDVLAIVAGPDVRWSPDAGGGGGGLMWSMLLMGG